MPQHGPTDRDPEPDSPGNRYIPPKLTMQLRGTRLHGTGETARLGPSKSSRATAHRETGELLHGPPAPPSPSARTNIRGESAAIQPCHCQQAPAERTASSETFHVEGARSCAGQESPTPSSVSRKMGVEQVTCRPDQEHALAAGSPSLPRHGRYRYWPGHWSSAGGSPGCIRPGMSAARIVLSVAGSGVWAAAATRRAGLAVAWSSSRTASRALPGPWSPSARASTAAAWRAASGASVNPASPAKVAKIAASCPAV